MGTSELQLADSRHGRLKIPPVGGTEWNQVHKHKPTKRFKENKTKVTSGVKVRLCGLCFHPPALSADPSRATATISTADQISNAWKRQAEREAAARSRHLLEEKEMKREESQPRSQTEKLKDLEPGRLLRGARNPNPARVQVTELRNAAVSQASLTRAQTTFCPPADHLFQRPSGSTVVSASFQTLTERKNVPTAEKPFVPQTYGGGSVKEGHLLILNLNVLNDPKKPKEAPLNLQTGGITEETERTQRVRSGTFLSSQSPSC